MLKHKVYHVTTYNVDDGDDAGYTTSHEDGDVLTSPYDLSILIHLIKGK